ncbi:PXA domain-containing protein [Aspergillus filifer]
MTTDPVPSGLHPFSHLKAGPTTSSSRSTAVPSSPTTAFPTQFSHRAQLSRNSNRDEPLNGTSEKATAALIRRVLCPQSGGYGGATSQYAPEELLPPLTSSNDVDRQLYALIAIIIKEFISSWYSKITSDQALINEVLQLVAHCTRALEQRLRGVDIAQLVLDDIPALIEAHIVSYRLAKEQSNLSGLTPSSREIYHALNPHPGLSPCPDSFNSRSVPQQQDNEAIYRRLLVNGVLTVLLPTEDLENASLRTLLSDIVADLVLGNEVSGRVCEGWFLWESTTKLLDALSRNSAGHEDDATDTKSTRPDRLHQYGLLSNTNSQSEELASTAQSQSLVCFWGVLQYAFFAYMTLRFVVVGLFRNASTAPGILPSRPGSLGSFVDEPSAKPEDVKKRPVLDYRFFGMLAQLLDISRRMPWLGGLLALVQYLILAGPGRVGDSGSILDRFLRENIEEYILTPTLLPNLLLASREALFPQNTRPKSNPAASVNRVEVLTSPSTPNPPTPGGVQATPIKDTQTTTALGGNAITPTIITPATATTAAPDQQQRRPSPAEVASIRRKCALDILSLVPRPIVRRALGIPAGTGPGPGSGVGPRRNSTYPQSPAQSPSGQFQESGPGAKQFDPPSLSLVGEADGDKAFASDPSGSDGGADLEESLLVEAVECDILDLFADEYCNKHLIYSIIETVLAKLLPELSECSIAELMEDRGLSTD